MSLNLDLSNLSNYTDQVQLPKLIRQTILPSTLANIGINYQENVTGTTDLNMFKLDLKVKAGGNCAAFSGTTGSQLYQQSISTSACLIENEDCPDKFKLFWTKIITKAGSYNEVLPQDYAAVYYSYLSESVKANVEDMWVSGSSTGTFSTTLTSANGILHDLYITQAGQYVACGSTYSGALTVANAINAFYDSRNKLPANILMEPDLVWLMGTADFNTLTQALVNANFFNPALYNNGNGDRVNGKMVIKDILGTNITVYAMRGFNYGSHRLMTNASNLYLGTDLNNDYETMRTWYSFDNNTVRTQVKWLLGAKVAYPAQCVLS